MLTLVALGIGASASLMEYLEVGFGGQLVLLPIVILASMVDRFYTLFDDKGLSTALIRLGWTLLLAAFAPLGEDYVATVRRGIADGWIDQNGIIVVDSAEVEVGGRSAEYRQFRLDTTPGATADFCPEADALGFFWLKKRLQLGAWVRAC